MDILFNETPHDIARLALLLMGELSAFSQMIISDIIRATDLDVASTRWLQRLTALPSVIERAMGGNVRSSRGGSDGSGRREMAAATATLTRTDTFNAVAAIPSDRSGTAADGEPFDLEVVVGHGSRHVSEAHMHHFPTRLTAREYQILNMANNGHMPRKIAKSLHLSVKTVYTHLRNARRKQRRLHAS
jgi:DNA-binding CsgD family transcriptional regulator